MRRFGEIFEKVGGLTGPDQDSHPFVLQLVDIITPDGKNDDIDIS
jgi:hypothetical protein